MDKMIRTREDSCFIEVSRLSIFYEEDAIRLMGSNRKLYPLQFLFLNADNVLIEYVPYDKHLKEIKMLQGDGSVSMRELEKAIKKYDVGRF